MMMEDTRPTVLLFCLNLGGHRQNYTFVFADWLLGQGYHLVLALGHGQDGIPGVQLPIMRALFDRPGVTSIDLLARPATSGCPGEWVTTVLELERRFGVSLTLFPTGDDLRQPLHGLGLGPRQTGLRRMAVWINLLNRYRQDWSEHPVLTRLRRRIGECRSRVREEYYFRMDVWKSLGLDRILTTNPDLMRYPPSPRFRYLAEIYRPWGCETLIPQESQDDSRRQVGRFLERHRDKTVLLYYGNWAARRGFDDLLALAVEHPDTVLVSCGRPGGDTKYLRDVPALMGQLQEHDRILDLRLPFLPFHPVVDDLFRATRFIVLPYRNFYGLSGSMIEAASYGKPVLVPDIGYMEARVRNEGIGLHFRHRHYADLRRQFQLMRETSGHYATAAMQFANQFDATHVRQSIEAALSEA
jgi:glycosyltransferase involved in cell wall biosynthesis